MAKVFRGGVPYAVDVKRLTEAFPVPTLTEGRVISHEELVPVVQTPQGSGRYYSVINSWLSQLKHTTGIIGKWQKDMKGILILDPAGILKYAEEKTREKMRQTAKAMKILAYCDRNRLDAIGQQRADHFARVFALQQAGMQDTHRQMAIDLAPVHSLPKPKLVRGA